MDIEQNRTPWRNQPEYRQISFNQIPELSNNNMSQIICSGESIMLRDVVEYVFKKLEIDKNLIPDQGRLLQCGSCNHEWFFKKDFKISITFFELKFFNLIS